MDKMGKIIIEYNYFEYLTLYHTLEKFYLLQKEIKITDSPVIKSNLKVLLTKLYKEAQKQADTSLLMLGEEMKDE